MRAVKYPPPVAVTIRFIPLPPSRIAQAAAGIAAMVRIGGTAEHHLVADELMAAGRIAAGRIAGDAHAR